MSRKYSTFSYKPGHSFAQKIPALVKILLLPIISVILFQADIKFAIFVVIFQFFISCSVKFSLKEQFQDLKLVIFYAFILYFISFLSHLFSNISAFNGLSNLNGTFFHSAKKVIIKATVDSFRNQESLKMLIKLFAVIQGAAIFYKTSTILEIREAIGRIEFYVRKLLFLSQKQRVTKLISLFISFIPMVQRAWDQLSDSWTIRRGNSSIKKYLILIPILFSISMKKAYDVTKGEGIRRVEKGKR